MSETPWTRHIEDAEKFRQLAEEAYQMGNMITHSIWQRLEIGKRALARRAKKRQER